MVLVDFRARLAGSGRPRGIFEATVEVAGAAGPIGAKRALDSTPIYDAVATMGTITLMRSAMRGLLKAADDGLEAGLRGVTRSGDGYATSAKPQVDWDDQGARDELVATRARDGHACLALLEGRDLAREVEEAAELLASVLGQDLEGTEDGSSRTARKVAKDRVVSTVGPEARHGRKTSARAFDGYRGHIAVDPDSEMTTGTTVTAGNEGDAAAAPELLDDLVGDGPAEEEPEEEEPAGEVDETRGPGEGPAVSRPKRSAGAGARSRKANKKADRSPTRAARAAERAARRAAKLERWGAVDLPARQRHRTPGEGTAALGARRRFHQRPFRRRPGRRHRRLPCGQQPPCPSTRAGRARPISVTPVPTAPSGRRAPRPKRAGPSASPPTRNSSGPSGSAAPTLSLLPTTAGPVPKSSASSAT